MTQKSLILFFFLFFYSFVNAQNELDVLRYSTTNSYGSARFEAMAGSFGALGADLSAIQINPAGMGRFSSSHAAIGINMSFANNSALFNSNRTASADNSTTVSVAGVVLTNDISRNNNGRKYSQITLGYTRLKNFNNHRVYEGNEFYSLLDVFANAGYGVDPSLVYDILPFTTGLAYDVYALDYDPSSMQYIPRLTMGDMHHKRIIDTEGGIGEFHIGYSENYMDKLYYGVSIGIRRIKYNQNINHYERLLDTVGTTLRSFNYLYELSTKGTGVNIKFGAIYLPGNNIRVGLAFESPTLISLKDEWTANMTAMHHDGQKYILEEYIPTGEFEYKMITPLKLRTSFAYIFGMRGAVNVDFELSHIPGGKLRPKNSSNLGTTSPNNVYPFDIENENVKQLFRTVINTRIGVEYMVYTNFYLRGGIAILPQPYRKEYRSISNPDMVYAGGIGWAYRFLRIDASYRLMQFKHDYYAFDPSKIENRTRFTTGIHSVVLTVTATF